MCAYVTFLVYNKIQSSFDIDAIVLTEQIEIDTEENTEKEIDFEDEIKLQTTHSVEVFISTDQEYKYYKNTHQFPLSSYVEHLTPPPKLSC
ncbi:hypothetical protein IMCC3317_30630 [Kordia antarctica]|uniref:Uncharacterized protein n=2 Tax=Kordia antarctica TaxID=1218801 RepID=A0A7L4ZM05_9FLAO|nr:hypothetical protein IMCC3317_30630 [Kordia antarctica]